jgi:hypothetical protein
MRYLIVLLVLAGCAPDCSSKWGDECVFDETNAETMKSSGVVEAN